MNRRSFIKRGALWVPPLFAVGRARGQALTLSDPAMVGRTRPAAASATTEPDDISGLELWLKADGNVYSDNGTTACNDGDTVYRWNDASTNGRYFVSTTSTDRPTYKTGILNSKPVIRFDGSNDYLYSASLFTSGFTSASLFVVLKIDADPPAAGGQTGAWEFGGQISLNVHFPWTDGTFYEDFGTTSRKTLGNLTDSFSTDWRLYNAETASGNFTVRVDGATVYNTATNTVGWASARAACTIGRSEDEGASYFLDGDVAEVCVYSAVLSSGDRASLESYFASKYGI